MKRRLTTALALSFALSVLPLAACSNKASTSEGAGGAQESAAVVDPSEKFIGTWKMAAIDQDGIVIVGDFSSVFESEDGMLITINDDSTGEMAFNDDTASFAWELKDDDTITLKVDKTEGEEESEDEQAVVDDDGTVELDYLDGSIAIRTEEEGKTGLLVFTADGTYKDYKVLSAENAEAITSKDFVIGDWNLAGMNFFGITMYGEAEALAEMVGEESDISASFAEDGTAKLMGQDVKWTMNDTGVMLDFGSDYTVPLKAMDDKILIDMSEVIGMDMLMVFAK